MSSTNKKSITKRYGRNNYHIRLIGGTT